ncbi:MAG: DNA primase [Verrucomicrobia bacterium]|nr:DNA primase [Verrucomicrobiota bacterium]
MAGTIPPHVIEQIRAASDIVDVIGSYLPLKRAGGNFLALCPFHREKTPSFNVSPSRQIFHCFGCHKGGDVFRFVQDYENITFIEAVRRLAERARIPLEFEPSPGASQTRFLKETLFTIHEQICQRWQTALKGEAGMVARDYLQRRGVSDEAVRLFRLGYAPDAWDDTVGWAKSKGHDLEIMTQAGLIVRKEPEGGGPAHYYDRFRGRLMFPICDEQGRVIAFSGRILQGDEKTAKYINSPETPIFTKGRVMFGLDKSKRAILDAGFAIICEGQLDLIACYMADVKNVVAPQGTALTGDHCRILKRYVNEVVLCFDSDTAGQNAALRSLDDLIASGLAIRVATVPAPDDPDSFIKARGGHAFRELVAGARGFFDYLLDRLSSENDLRTDRGRNAVVAGMADALLKTGNAVLTDTYAQKTAQRLGVSVDALRAEFKRASRAPRTVVRDAATNVPPDSIESPPPPSVAESWLLKLLLLDSPARVPENREAGTTKERPEEVEPDAEALVAWAMDHLDLEWIQHDTVRRLIAQRFEAQRAGTWRGVAAWLTELADDPAAQRLVTEQVAEGRPVKHRQTQLVDVTRRLRDAAIDRELLALEGQLRAAEAGGGGAGLELLAAQQRLRLAKREPLRPIIE